MRCLSLLSLGGDGDGNVYLAHTTSVMMAVVLQAVEAALYSHGAFFGSDISTRVSQKRSAPAFPSQRPVVAVSAPLRASTSPAPPPHNRLQRLPPLRPGRSAGQQGRGGPPGGHAEEELLRLRVREVLQVPGGGQGGRAAGRGPLPRRRVHVSLRAKTTGLLSVWYRPALW